MVLRICRLAALLLAFSPVLVAARADLNPEYGDPTYRANTVFSPDAASPAEYKQRVIVVFHGFMSAVPNGTFKRLYRKFRRDYTVIGINYNPLEVERTLGLLNDVALRHLQGRQVTVIGTSLGGFWARYFGKLTRAHRVVMLNPLVRPQRQLQKYAGRTRQNVRRARKYVIRQTDLADYARFDVRRFDGPPTLLIVTLDDDFVDPNIAIRTYRGSVNMTIEAYDSGGHTIKLQRHNALQRIAEFLVAPS
ncbi:MAG: YqiA/YcfP family alpha/beta fold hydrolase [Pseudomonadota bacterium]